ncbi:MAG: sulfatase-like hydrolase/transferase [Pseudomonadota bacterium]
MGAQVGTNESGRGTYNPWGWVAGLGCVLLFSWISGLKSLLSDWVNTGDEAESSTRPNILLLVADDLGYNDISSINAQGINTPNIDSLAEHGVTFTRHYADSTCTPSRVAILTGRYPERSGFRPVGAEIPADFPTIAQRLREEGYATYLTGKWHAGEARSESWPQHKGFPQWFGFLNQFELSPEPSTGSDTPRRPTYHNPLLRVDGGHSQQYKGHLTDILTQHTIDKIQELDQQGQPWFIYHAFLAPHAPIQPAARFRSAFPDTPAGRYEALVTQLDNAVGRLLDRVDERNTLVVFVSDNGGTNQQRDNNFPFYGHKNQTYEGAYRTPLIVHWPSALPVAKQVEQIVMNVDLFPTLLAFAGAPPDPSVDGVNLLPVLQSDARLEPRARGWENYSTNVGILSHSFLSASGRWRLSNQEGIGAKLFDLVDNPAGDKDVAHHHHQDRQAINTDFWDDQWQKSLVPVASHVTEEQTVYSGFDAMRTPFLHGFSIGLELGPLPSKLLESTTDNGVLLAGQDGVWQLDYRPGLGLEWRIGDAVLRDASFKPTRCNPIILTGYIEPLAHLAVREPMSPMKLYANGSLQDEHPGLSVYPATARDLAAPSVVNYGGRAIFSNTALSAWGDPYRPRISAEFEELYTQLHKSRGLAIVTADRMMQELCQD